MKKFVFLICLLTISLQAMAILSPLNQSIAEIEAILHAPELQLSFSQSAHILEIERVKNGYNLITEEKRLFVELHYLPVERPGKQQFKLIFNDVEYYRRGTVGQVDSQ